MENLNSELSNNNIEQLKEKFNSGLNKIDIEKIWISNHKNLEKIYINLEEIRKYIQEYNDEVDAISEVDINNHNHALRALHQLEVRSSQLNIAVENINRLACFLLKERN